MNKQVNLLTEDIYYKNRYETNGNKHKSSRKSERNDSDSQKNRIIYSKYIEPDDLFQEIERENYKSDREKKSE